ncbi:MAG: hypothetical protein HSCHL_2243 [Hydrogenibacillus schlegelii]|uniref:Uncharacterized protein n=1 Tax=Hydrogenibacillus schlegelii TaxID=1484 RepID=A0A2T5GEP2_HYDSH|nr:MAG: hypothetical protein HSCHL_2243 [Hydrogenibacillus schlegelii]
MPVAGRAERFFYAQNRGSVKMDAVRKLSAGRVSLRPERFRLGGFA